jgi:hypothetical protein
MLQVVGHLQVAACAAVGQVGGSFLLLGLRHGMVLLSLLQEWQPVLLLLAAGAVPVAVLCAALPLLQ